MRATPKTNNSLIGQFNAGMDQSSLICQFNAAMDQSSLIGQSNAAMEQSHSSHFTILYVYCI